VNFYADWTQTEISGIFHINLGLRTVKESLTKEKIGAFPNVQTIFKERRLTEQLP
jgi:hypothetical protein